MARRSRGTAAAGGKRAKRATSAEPVIKGNGWLDDFVPYQLYRVTNKLNARLLKRLKTLRINTSQWRVLSVLRAYGPLSTGSNRPRAAWSHSSSASVMYGADSPTWTRG